MNIKNLIVPVLMTVLLISCQKDFLDKKPNKALLVPTTLADLQSLLDNTSVMNVAPTLQTLAADEYTIAGATLNSWSNAYERNSYLWADEPYEGKSIADWNRPYEQIFYANVVLDGLEKIEQQKATEVQYQRTKGSALFYRAIAHYHLLQLFAGAYHPSDLNAPGIPYRKTADVNIWPNKSTLHNTYQMIIEDLSLASQLLPPQAPYKGSPGRAAAYALLARVYLLMGLYSEAQTNADLCLELNNKLIDFNSLTPSASRPISGTNDELLFYTIMISYSFSGPSASSVFVNTDLFKSYDTNDLRRTVFFNNKGNDNVLFKGNYTGSSTIFAGIATDEVYLIKAECEARRGLTEAAMQTLNLLLIKRWDKTKFQPLVASDKNEALAIILKERKKELVTRGIRWSDLKRLNTEPQFAITLKRIIDGKEYLLAPGGSRYIFPIPDNEIQLTGVRQNQ